MNLKSIKVGRWYETKLGAGECTRAGGTFPPSVMVRIVAPFPRGLANLTPREVTRELTPAEVNLIKVVAGRKAPFLPPFDALCNVCMVAEHDQCANNANCPCCCDTMARARES